MRDDCIRNSLLLVVDNRVKPGRLLPRPTVSSCSEWGDGRRKAVVTNGCVKINAGAIVPSIRPLKTVLAGRGVLTTPCTPILNLEYR
jgi:hypothetical protein